MIKTKHIKLLGILLTVLSFSPMMVKAYKVTINSNLIQDEEYIAPGEEDEYKYVIMNPNDDGAKYTCQYKKNASTWGIQTMYLDAYDAENKKLTEHSLNIAEANAITAGTAVGINIYEVKTLIVSQDLDFYVTYTEAPTCSVWETTQTCNCCTTKNNTNKNCIYEKYLSITLFSRIKSLLPVISPELCKPTELCKEMTNSCQSWSSYGCNPSFSCSGSLNCGTKTTSCKVMTPEQKKYITDSENYWVKECYETISKAIESGKKWNIDNPTYKIYINDSNDYNANNDIDDPTKQIIGEKGCDIIGGCKDMKYEYKSNGNGFHVYTKEEGNTIFSYYPNAVCMEIKTGNVRYLLGTEKKCAVGEMEIKNDRNENDEYDHWHYFTPLNTKSSNDFIISVLHGESGEKLEEEHCNSVIDNHPTEYQNLMIDGNTEALQGGSDSVSKEKAKLQIQKTGGCYLQSVIHIPIKQSFYGEKTKTNSSGETTTNLNGFNFYYKPIDITNPFPNGISQDSLWDKWYQEYKNNGTYPEYEEPDLSNSFTEISYIASNINTKKIREYNKTYPYTTWSTMNVDGTSQYIENEGIIEKTNNATSVYKLGCGPLNMNEYLDEAKTVKNLLYQKECAK